MQKMLNLVIIAFLYHFYFCIAAVEVLRPRGVSLSRKVFYSPDQDFSCIDGSSTIPFSFVNDDYCDCEDGSDEPGTSACANAVFHCINAGHVSLNIPSSRINDNICDCCDGSDEFNSTADCMNICLELGRQAREEQQKQHDLYEKGYSLWQQYSVQGKQIKENNRVQLENLKKTEGDLEKLMTEKEAAKNMAEDKEKAALAVYKSAEEEQKKQQEETEILQHQEVERKNSEAAFHELDLDKDDVLTFLEIQQFQKFDSDHDGLVSENEAKFFLHMKNSMSLEEFVTTGWMIMKPVFLLDKEPGTEAPDREEEKEMPDSPKAIHEEESDDETYSPETEEDMPLDDDDLLDEDGKRPVFPPKETETAKPEEPVYDEQTQSIVDAANDARKQHKESVDELEKVKDEIRQLQAFNDADFGNGLEFAVLKGQCFDFEDREYTYRFCPFDKASQIAKSAGSDVNLGRWGSWIGSENKYSKMRYDNGQTCWNGPARSVVVQLKCSLENKLLSSTEPNRCEYLFEFSTPALCSMHENVGPVHQHTEL